MGLRIVTMKVLNSYVFFMLLGIVFMIVTC